MTVKRLSIKRMLLSNFKCKYSKKPVV